MGSAWRDCSKIFVTAHPSSKSGTATNRHLRHRQLHYVNRTVLIRSTSFVFPKAKAQHIHCYFIQFLIMFSEFMIMLCLVTSMIELFMLDLVMLMIYLFRNVIMQLSHISTDTLIDVEEPLSRLKRKKDESKKRIDSKGRKMRVRKEQARRHIRSRNLLLITHQDSCKCR